MVDWQAVGLSIAALAGAGCAFVALLLVAEWLDGRQ